MIAPAAEAHQSHNTLAEVAAAVVASWPEPTDEQLQKVSALLRLSNGGA